MNNDINFYVNINININVNNVLCKYAFKLKGKKKSKYVAVL